MSATKDPKDLWRIALAQIEVKLDSPAQFKTFFQGAKLIDFSQGKVSVGVANGYVLDWIKQRKYDIMLKDVLSHVYGKEIKLDLDLLPTANKEETYYESPLLSMQQGMHTSLVDTLRKSGLNEKYSLSNFVVGDSNRIAHAAGLAIVDRPGKAYNPLFLHGKTGVGKTHLAQAIGRAVLERSPNNKVMYVSSENFLNEMVSGIRGGNMAKFRQKFRDLNILIIDDIQLISKWVKTQDEFFNTFNELQNNSSQVILISDRPPEEIQDLEDRLRSRFRGGLVSDMEHPDYELRLAILKQRCIDLAIHLGDQILAVIAKAVNDNVRELEGALQKVALFNQMKTSGELSIEEVQRIVGADTASKRDRIKVPNVIKKVAQAFGVSVKDIKDSGRKQEVAFARQVAMYILREEFGYKLEDVAEFLNRKDHTTVLHGVEKIKSKILTTEPFKQQLLALIRELQEQPLS